MLTIGGEELSVRIYDDFDDGAFGRSLYRSVFREVNLSAFGRSITQDVASPSHDETSHLTAVLLSADTAAALEKNHYKSVRTLEEGYLYQSEGLEFVFSFEKAGEDIFRIIREYYQGTREIWLEELTGIYEDNYVIRIHRGENIFDPWKDVITLNEALLMATVIGDREQPLWGIHDGLDILNQDF